MDPVSLQAGGQKQLTVKEAELLQAAGVTVSWTSDDPKVADVSTSGLVKAVGAGTTTIRASVQTDKKTVSGTCTITVTAAGGNNGRGNGGGGDNGNNKGGSGSGGGGTLKGQKTSGGTYSDRLVGTASQGSTDSRTGDGSSHCRGQHREWRWRRRRFIRPGDLCGRRRWR